MTRLSLLVVALSAGSAVAQEPRFRWAAGDVLTYAVEQTTLVADTSPDESGKIATGQTRVSLKLTKQWNVKAVDAAGVGTVELAVVSMKQEVVRPGPKDKDGNATIDRTVIDTDTPEGKEATGGFLGKPSLVVKIDPLGRLVEAKSPDGKPAGSRIEAELPFRVVFPEAVAATWVRPFTIKLDPPNGTGETHQLEQTYAAKPAADGLTVVGVATALKAVPKDPAELQSLVPLLWEGDVYFQPATGRYAGAKLVAKREVPNHAGDGSKFVYESRYTESLVK